MAWLRLFYIKIKLLAIVYKHIYLYDISILHNNKNVLKLIYRNRKEDFI